MSSAVTAHVSLPCSMAVRTHASYSLPFTLSESPFVIYIYTHTRTHLHLCMCVCVCVCVCKVSSNINDDLII
uniref:Uncharacterized protein n=1 Tax=Octopus bimaculoides TaxID=37653 RepID=A0A0L8HN57_OCTBM